MKKLALLLVLFLVACGQQVVCNEPYIQVGNECCLDKDANQICDKDEAPEVDFSEVQSEQIDEEELAPEQEKQAIDEILEKIESRVTSYRYTTPYARYDGSTWYIKNNMVRVDLHDPLTIKAGLEEGLFADILIFDTDKETVMAYCKHREHVCRDSADREFELDFDKYWAHTPIDLLQRYRGDKEEVVKWEGELVEDRLATMIVFKEPDQKTTIWVDAHYGVPLRIKTEKGKTITHTTFDEMAFNTVKDEIFTDFNIRYRR